MQLQLALIAKPLGGANASAMHRGNMDFLLKIAACFDHRPRNKSLNGSFGIQHGAKIARGKPVLE
jgi:hypothetical protein